MALDFQSAVSQNCILRSNRSSVDSRADLRPADCKSAIRQIENLRYAKRGASPVVTRNVRMREERLRVKQLTVFSWQTARGLV